MSDDPPSPDLSWEGLHAALAVAVLALDLIEKDRVAPRMAAGVALKQLREKFGVTPENT